MVKNTGKSPVTPRIRLESRGGAGHVVSADGPIAPGAEARVVVPFAAAVTAVIPTDPKQEIVGPGKWEEQNWAPTKGTGTTFASTWVNGITLLSDRTEGAKNLTVTSIRRRLCLPGSASGRRWRATGQ